MPELSEFEQMVLESGSSLTNRNAPPDMQGSSYSGLRYRTNEDRRAQSLEALYRSSDGTPLETDTSLLTGSQRAGLSFRRTPQDQIDYLEDTLGYGKGMVRMAGDVPIVRVIDTDTGKERDVLVDEANLTWKDVSDLANVVPEVAGSALALIAYARGRGGGKTAIPKGWIEKTKHFLKQSAVAAIGGQTAGGVGDVSMRLQDMPDNWNEGNLLEDSRRVWNEIDPGEIVKHRLMMGAIDTATGGVMEGAGLALNRAKNMVANPFVKSREATQNDMIAAALFLEKKLVDPETGKGVKILDHLPVGATTGNQLLARGETFVHKVLSGTGAIGRREKELKNTIVDAMNVIVGKKKLPTDYDIGAKIVSQMREVLDETGKQVKKADWNVSRVGSEEIRETLLGQASKKDAGFARESVGRTVRAAVVKKRDEAKKRWGALYDNVENILINQKDGGKVFSTDEIKRVTRELEGKLPTIDAPPSPVKKVKPGKKRVYDKKGQLVREEDVSEEVTIGSGIKTRKRTREVRDKRGRIVHVIKDEAKDMDYDEFGELVQVPGKNVHGELIHPAYYPDSVKKFLGQQNLGEKQTLGQLRQMRTVVNEAIRDSNAMPGVSRHYLQRISKAITKSIEDGLDKIPDKKLKNALKEANTIYKNNHEQFRDLRIARYFKTPDESGFMGDTAIINELIENSDGDMFHALKEYFTKGMKNSKGVTEAPSKELLDTWESIKLAYVDGIISKASDDPLGRQINPSKLTNLLSDIGSKSPFLLKETFGEKLPRIQKISNLMMEQKGTGPILDRDLIVDYLNQRTTTKKALNEYVKIQEARDTALKNDIIKPFMQGDNSAIETIPVHKLVDRFIEQGKNLDAVKGFMDRVKSLPDGDKLAEDMQRKVIIKLFKKSADRAKHDPHWVKRTAFGYSEVPSEIVSGRGLAKELNERREFYDAVLEPEQLKMIESIGKISAGIEKRDELGGVAGSLVGGGLMRKILADNGSRKLAGVYEYAKYYVAGAIVSSKSLRKWASNSYQWGDMPALYKGLLLTPPVIRGMAQDMEDPEAFWTYLDAMRREEGIKPDDEFYDMIQNR